MDNTSELGAGDSGVESISSNDVIMVTIEISIPDLNLQKSFQFNHEETVWKAKQHVLFFFAKDLINGFNYGFYCPPMNGKAGKFLDEERLLKEYSPLRSNWNLEFKIKRRVYKSINLTMKRAKQLQSRGNCKQFLEHVRKLESEKIVKFLNKGMDPNFIESESGETPLTMASMISKPSKVIMALVGGGAHLDFRNKKGMTPLHAATWKGNEEAIKVLLDLGSSANYKDLRGLTPLYLGISNEVSSRCIEMLLYDHSAVDTTDEQGWTELHQSCKTGRVQHVELLVYFGADLNSQNCSGNTPLHISVINGKEDCARTLLFRGANKSILNHSNRDAFQCALISGNTRLAETIRNFSDQEVVPYLDAPKYNTKRRVVHQLPMGALKRCRSNPLMNCSLDGTVACKAGGPQEGCSLWNNQQQPRQFGRSGRNSTALQDLSIFGRRSPPSKPLCSFEGLNQSFSISSVDSSQEGEMIFEQKTIGDLKSEGIATRQIVLSTDSSDFGFILRGTKADRIISSRKNLVLTPSQPALQYFEQVITNSLADKAGIKPGDFLLEVNGVDVTSASHEYTVSLIKNSVHSLGMLITTPVHAHHSFNSIDYHQKYFPASTYSLPKGMGNFSSLKTFAPPCEFPSIDKNIASIRSVHGKRLAHNLPVDEHDNVRVVSVPSCNGNSLTKKFLWKAKSIHNLSRSDDICYMFDDDDDDDDDDCTLNIDSNKSICQTSKNESNSESNELISCKVPCADYKEELNGSSQCSCSKVEQKLGSFDSSFKDKQKVQQYIHKVSKLQPKNSGILYLSSTSVMNPIPPVTHSTSPNYSETEGQENDKNLEHFDFLSLAESARQVYLDCQRTSSNEESEKLISLQDKIILKDKSSLKDRYAMEPYNMYNTTKEISKLALVSNRRQFFECNSLKIDGLNPPTTACPGAKDDEKLITKSPLPPKPPQKPYNHLVRGSVPQPPEMLTYCHSSPAFNDLQASKNKLMQLPPLPSQMQLSITSADTDILIVPPPPGFEDDSEEHLYKPSPFECKDDQKSISKRYISLPMNLWSVDDVASWLDSMGMCEHKITFIRNNVDGAKLSTLGRNDLISLGVVQVGQRMGLERAVKKILISYSSS